MSYKGFDVTGKVCIVTGGTSGLGKSIALGLAQSGAKVIAGSSSAGKVDAVKKELGAGNEAIQIDVSSEASVEAAMKHAVSKFGRLDAVINAAGVIGRQPSIDLPVAEFERIVKINLTGSFIVAKHAAHHAGPGPRHARRARLDRLHRLSEQLYFSQRSARICVQQIGRSRACPRTL